MLLFLFLPNAFLENGPSGDNDATLDLPLGTGARASTTLDKPTNPHRALTLLHHHRNMVVE